MGKDAWERRIHQLARTRIKPAPPVEVAERRRFHTETTEFKHREHGGISANFPVHSVIQLFDGFNGKRLGVLPVKRFGICSSRCHFMNKPGWSPNSPSRILAPVSSIFDLVKSLRPLDHKSPNRPLAHCEASGRFIRKCRNSSRRLPAGTEAAKMAALRSN